MVGYYTLDIAELTKGRKNSEKQPFPHQKEAFAALSKTLPIPIEGYRGTLLVLPTGGGKTFTSINWICRNIIPKGIKVIWLAQSSYLLDQAADAFIKEIHNANERNVINLRVVSGSTAHSNSGSIALTDDILICTTQTAISAFGSEQLDGRGEIVKTPFRNFVDSCKDTELFIVIDEAHHTPAYGCRTLLLDIRKEIKKLYVLGLTATPMHMDKRISGWLKEIYDQWICYEVDKSLLQANKILAVPKYIEKDTGMEFEVDDGLFDRLVNKHKDLPDFIVESLANNQSRNNYIISDFIANKKEYGKTIIFADRWFQCEYILEKLKEEKIKANAVYSVVTSQDSIFKGGSGRRNNKENEKIMQDFREGKYDVIINVKMLTEGVDVPDVKTVMITRQTTSNILLTQMIGRALRGEKAGGGKGKDYANIVFFHDTWKRLLPWADVNGRREDIRPEPRGGNLRAISIQLIKLATADIDYKGFGDDVPYLTFIPVGFYSCEYTVAIEDESAEELISFEENIIVYEFNKEKYIKLIDYISVQDLSIYSNECVIESQIEEKAKELSDKFFDLETDNFDGLLVNNVTKIVHHIAQNNNTKPLFVDFDERDDYDMDSIAKGYIRMSTIDKDILLNKIFNDESLYWNFFYKTFNNFMDAYYKSEQRILNILRGNPTLLKVIADDVQAIDLTDEIKEQIRTRDNYTCLCCGKNRGKGRQFHVDHITPVSMGGTNAVSNLQTLCSHCNKIKGKNTIKFSANKTPRNSPKPNLEMFECRNNDYVENAVARIVNMFYHCNAMCTLNYHQRSNGQYYSTWEIVLYAGNNPEWLQSHEEKLLGYVHSELGWYNVKNIVVKN